MATASPPDPKKPDGNSRQTDKSVHEFTESGDTRSHRPTWSTPSPVRMSHDFRRPSKGGAASTASQHATTPGKRALTHSLPQPVQAKGDASGGADTVARAARGVEGSGGSLPFRDTIQKAFGRHDVGDVRAHTGHEAASAARDIGAVAYATGNDVAFAGAPDLHTAAHEAAHVVQQRSGVHLKDGVGSANDAYEQHADAVADLVVQGNSAEAVLDTMAGPVPGSLQLMPVVQREADPLEAEATRVLATLDKALAEGQWEVIRARVYPREAAATHARHNERRAGARADLQGLGAVASLDKIAGAVQALQAHWSDKDMTPDKRADALLAAANAGLGDAHVFKLRDRDIREMTPRGAFAPEAWGLVLRKLTMESATMSSSDAAEVAGVIAHEARHAEQSFLQARLIAGKHPKKSAASIAGEIGIHPSAAKDAKTKPMKKDDPRFAEAETMDKALRIDGAANAAISDNATNQIAELKRLHAIAEAARAALNAQATRHTIDVAMIAADDVRKQITTVETAYLAYRSIPYEADAHEVGDSTSEAFAKLP